MKHIFIVNPAAGDGKLEKLLLPQLITFLKGSGLDYEIHRTLNKPEVASYVRQRAEKGDEVRFYACGGDGTICDVVNGMVGFENAQLAVYPCGTGNDFVRNFTNPKNFKDFQKLVSGDVIDCDVIKYNDSYCINMLNIGADCDIVVASSAPQYKKLGGLSYAGAALSVLTKGKTYEMEYEFEGEMHKEQLLLCAIANGNFCGGGFHSSPNASLNDGMIDVTVVRPVPGKKLVPLLLKYRSGTHLQDKDAEKYILHFRCESFSLYPKEPVHVSVDGEVFDFEDTHFEIVHNAVRLALPEGCEMIK